MCKVRHFKYIESIYNKVEKYIKSEDLGEDEAKKIISLLKSLQFAIVNDGKKSFGKEYVFLKQDKSWSKDAE